MSLSSHKKASPTLDDMDSPTKNAQQTTEVTELDEAAARLEAMHYAPELRRNLSMLTILGLGAAIIAAPFGLSTSASFALINGGGTSYVWGWALLSIISVAIAASLGEICSVYPTSGGVYVWTAYLAPRKSAPLFSFIVGWVSIIANVLLTLSIAFGEAQLIMSAISVFRNNEWAPQAWQTILMFWLVMLVSATINAGGVRGNYLEALNVASMWWTGASSIIILVVVLAMCDDKRTGAEVFAQWNNTSGWPDGWSFFVGLLTPAYVLTGYGTISYLAEEVYNPEVAVPRAMVGSVLAASATGFLYVIPLAFVFPADVSELLTSAAGQPIVVAFSRATGSAAGAFGLLFLILVIGMFASVGSLTVSIRAAWSFSRDGGLPFSNWLRVVDKRLHLPLNSLYLNTLIISLLGLIYLGAAAAFAAFTGSCTILLGISYTIPVLCSMLKGRRPMAEASWSLGALGWPANIVALTWVLFSIVLFCFPTTADVDPTTMNYASVVVMFFAAFAAIYYFVWAKKHYVGPIGALDSHERADALKKRGRVVDDVPVTSGSAFKLGDSPA